MLTPLCVHMVGMFTTHPFAVYLLAVSLRRATAVYLLTSHCVMLWVTLQHCVNTLWLWQFADQVCIIVSTHHGCGRLQARCAALCQHTLAVHVCKKTGVWATAATLSTLTGLTPSASLALGCTGR